MMRRYILILTLLFFCFGFSSPHSRIIARKNAVAAPVCDTTSIIFWWRCEAADFSGTNGTTDYSAGDDIGALASAAAINTDAVKYGTNGLDLPTPSDYILFDPPIAALEEEGRIGFWMRLTSFTDTRRLVNVTEDAGDFFYIQLDGTDELEFYWYDAGTARTEFITSGANLTTATWYFVEAAWKTSTDYREIFVNGTSYGSSSATIENFDTAPAWIAFGDGTGTAQDTHTDNIIISTDSTVDLYTVCKDELEWPE